jgi:hypothetical protein
MKSGERCPSVSWDDIFKIKIRNFDDSTDLHDIVKLLIMKKLARKNKKDKSWIRIYSEYPVTINKETRIADVVYQNIRTKEIYAFEVQKDLSQKWIDETLKFYENWDKELSNIFFKTAQLIIVPIDKIEESIDMVKLKKEIDKFII